MKKRRNCKPYSKYLIYNNLSFSKSVFCGSDFRGRIGFHVEEELKSKNDYLHYFFYEKLKVIAAFQSMYRVVINSMVGHMIEKRLLLNLNLFCHKTFVLHIF